VHADYVQNVLTFTFCVVSQTVIPFFQVPGCPYSLDRPTTTQSAPTPHPIMRHDYVLIICSTSVNTDKKAAKRKIIWDPTVHLPRLTQFTGKHLTDLHIREVSRAMTNTGKYAVPVFYIRVPGDDPVSLASHLSAPFSHKDQETIFQRMALVREKRTVFSKLGMYAPRQQCGLYLFMCQNLAYEERRNDIAGMG
jgi:hypothetical protein